MSFTKEQIDDIKQQLISYVDKLDNPNKEQIKKYIENLNEQELEEFLKKNNISVSEKDGLLEQEKQNENEKECIFCSIIKGIIPSYKLNENNKSIAVLEINPLSKGHSIILPKEHLPTEKIPKTAMSLAQKIANKIKKKLKPDDIKIETSSFQGHCFINVIPLYRDIPLKKQKAEEKDLKFLKNKLEQKHRISKKIKDKSENDDRLPKISFRIP
ncbi:MAG: HIT domain-containing protein [Candidatus Pacearchaeota archaeon]